MIRKLNLNDLVKLEKYAKFPMPQIMNPNYVLQWSLIDDDQALVGSVFVKKTCEVIMIFDETVNKVTRSKSWLEAFDLLDQVGPAIGFDDVHAFVTGPNSCTHSMLMKKLGFVPATGIPLYYEIGSSKWLNHRRTKRQTCPKDSQQVPSSKLKQDSSEVPEELLVQLA